MNNETEKLLAEASEMMAPARTTSLTAFQQEIKRVVELELSELEEQEHWRRIKREYDTTFEIIRREAKRWKKKTTTAKPSLELQVAQDVIESIGAQNLISDGSETWIYEAPTWRPLPNAEVRRVTSDVMKENGLSDKIENRFLNGVAALIDTEVFAKGHQWNIDRTAINCSSGVLIPNGHNFELHPHNRESYRTEVIPVKYIRHAIPRKWFRTLKQIFRNNPDWKDKIRLLSEMFGYALIASSRYDKYLLMVGEGANGKDLILAVLMALVGYKNCSTVPIHEQGARFSKIELRNKLANVVAEVAAKTTFSDSDVKEIVSGSPIHADVKFKPAVTFNPYCTCFFASNVMPKTSDVSHGFFRRPIILKFDRIFGDHEQDKTLRHELIKDLPGILNFALCGLSRLYKNDHFTIPKSSTEALTLWKITSGVVDPLKEFVEDCCDVGPGKSIRSSELYERYCKWGPKKVTNTEFSRELKKLGFVTGIVDDSKGRKRLEGINLKEGER